MQIFLWIIGALVVVILVLSVLILLCILILKLSKNRLSTSKQSVIVRPEIVKPINAFDESNLVFARISSPSVITVSEYPLQKASIKKPERKRSSNKKSSWASKYFDPNHSSFNDTVLPLTEMEDVSDRNTTPCHAISGFSKKRSREFVDRDPPSDESKCDYLDPMDLNFSQLRNMYTASDNFHQSNQTDWPIKNFTVATYA
ncbi:unnamed protein product [Onchocerca flexuosa]|uniref:Uncharacterized protein n=1 Tax=Onchocerca flexuosa TaxID=387005 RepID=A0A183H2Q6_9BILA|nr:unnamed protein product [Onchocerca flexuosa]